MLANKKGASLHHLQTLLSAKPRDLKQAHVFAPSVSTGTTIAPAITENQQLNIFYCGINWDILIDGKSRNEGLMKLLDRQGVMKYFGPNDNFGKHPWAGYECYQHEIPFDGISVPREIHKCGICLVLSSDAHRRTGIATNRIFEACAAGAVIISDDNFMVREMFGDAVLYIDYNRNDVKDTCRQILEQYDWIINHREDAQRLAERAQQIFREKYSLNLFLANLVNHHADRVETIAHSLYAIEDDKNVAVFYVCNSLDIREAERWTSRVLANVIHQDYPSIVPLIAADLRVAEELSHSCSSLCASAKVVPMPLYDKFEARRLTDGQAIVNLRCMVPHSYFMITNSDETWYADHVTTLVRTLEDQENADAAYAAQVHEHDKRKDFHNFKVEPEQMLFVDGEGKKPSEYLYPYPGVFLFRNKCHNLLPDDMFDYLDGREYAAYVHRIIYHAKQEIVFTKRVSFAFPDKYEEPHHLLISRKRERRYILDLTSYDRPRYHTVSGKVTSGEGITAAAVNPNFSQLTQEDIYARFTFPWDAVPAGSNIVIYGGGIVGKTYLEQLIRSNYCTIKAICDKHPDRTGIQQIPVISLKKLAGLDPSSYDMVLIAIERRDIAKEIREDLEMMGLPMNKVRWIDPAKER